MESGNNAWILTCAALVMFMTPGLAFFYGGMVRTKNVLSMLMQNFIALGVISVVWALVGFSIAFGPDWAGLFGGLSLAGLNGLFGAKTLPGFEEGALSIPPTLFMAFQMMFAVITPALISGAIADRMKFGAYVLFIAVWSVLCYAPLAHWVWSPSGWLLERGALDFAGGTVVHINAGVAALALALALGRRRLWPREAMPPHSLPLTLLGTGMLWFGWIGFNAGSALGAGELAAQALVTTQLGAATGMLGWLIAERVKRGKATTLGAASGAVAGLVAITPAAGFVSGGSAMIIGLVAGAVCFLAVNLKFRLGYDDALDVVGVHLVGGLVGSLMVGLLADVRVNEAGANGLLYGGGMALLTEQIIAVVATIAFTGAMSLAIAKVIDWTIGLRVEEEAEHMGLDQAQHAESAYALTELGAMTREEPVTAKVPGLAPAPRPST